MKHKSLISGLGHHINAKKMQQGLYYKHLASQYQDRVEYWRQRGISRSKGLDVTFIQDGLDQNKLLIPRGRMMRAKCFEKFLRPKLHLVAAICHGRHVALYLSEMDIPKDSNTTCEVISKTLHPLGEEPGVDLASVRITCQADNTCRETKNNIVARYMASLVSDRVVSEATMSFLRSGHSHEDVDQLFAQVSDWLNRHLRVAESSDDVMDCLQKFLDQLDRPNEPLRFLHKVDTTRNWTHSG